jgi:hypothetical protein
MHYHISYGNHHWEYFPRSPSEYSFLPTGVEKFELNATGQEVASFQNFDKGICILQMHGK